MAFHHWQRSRFLSLNDPFPGRRLPVDGFSRLSALDLTNQKGHKIHRFGLLSLMAANHVRFGGLIDVAKVLLKVVGFKIAVVIRQRRYRVSASSGAQGAGPQVQLPTGEFLLLDPEDTGLSVELASTRTHEPHATELMVAATQRGATVIDAGSNIGYYASRLATKVGPEGRLICVEPSPSTAALLRRNLEVNAECEVIFHEVVISDSKSTVDFFVATEKNVSSVKPRAGSTRIEVPALTIDDIAADIDRVDLIRMDIEGHELEALRGAEGTLARWHPRVVAEIHLPQLGTRERSELLMLLGRHGYTCDWFVFRWDDVQLFGSTWFSGPQQAKREASLEELFSINGETVVASLSHRRGAEYLHSSQDP